jgi:hypothetical protein
MKQTVQGREAILQDLKESNDAISKIRTEASLNTYRRLNTRSNEKQRHALSQDLDKSREPLSLDLEKSNDGVDSKILGRGSGEGGDAAKARADKGLQEMTNHVLQTQSETAQHEFPMQKEFLAPLVRVCARACIGICRLPRFALSSSYFPFLFVLPCMSRRITYQNPSSMYVL